LWPTYGDESDIDEEDRALIKEDSPLMPPMPPYQTQPQLMYHNTNNATHQIQNLRFSFLLTHSNDCHFTAIMQVNLH